MKMKIMKNIYLDEVETMNNKKCPKHNQGWKKLTAEELLYGWENYQIMKKASKHCRLCKKQWRYEKKIDKQKQKQEQQIKLKELCS